VCGIRESTTPKMAALENAIFEVLDDYYSGQRFNIILMRSSKPSVLKLAKISEESKRKVRAFFDTVQTDEAADPIPALKVAFDQHVDLICLITDRDFADDGGVLQEVRRREKGFSTRIRTFALVGPDPVDHDPAMIDFLQQLAGETGGAFRAIYWRAKSGTEEPIFESIKQP
jgi:hypothetical protein